MTYRLLTLLLVPACLSISHGQEGGDLAADGFSRNTFQEPKEISKNWQAKNRDGAAIDLNSIIGTPTVVVLFRGHGCYHCLQQLDELELVESRFRSRGCRLVAISNEPTQTLDQALQQRSLPFPVLSDEESKLAKSLGSESIKNWHGILLLDGNGKLSWQLSGSKPLMDFREIVALIDKMKFTGKPLESHEFVTKD